MGFTSIGMSRLSTQYYLVPVAATTAGTSHNPTSDTVQFAFMPQATQVPGVSDWAQGSWQTVPTNIIYPYAARCLVGPSGTVNPGIGTYYVYCQITDSPEIPALITGILQIQ